ncbi:MAG: hypothetical protein WCB57_00415 [Pseudonocardiaceae bacterium]
MGRFARRMASGVAAVAMVALTSGVAAADTQAPTPVASIPNVTGVSTSVALDSGFVSALKSLDVAPSPSGKATVDNGVATFPITGGHITVYKPGEVDPYVQGILMHDGSGLTLTKGNTAVTLENFVVDPGNPATLTGKVLANGNVLAGSTKLFDLDGSTLQPITTNAQAGTATLQGTTVKLSDGAATALNKAFSTDALKGGTTVGIATIVVKLPGQGQAQAPSGGVAAGGGSTSGVEYAGLLGAGAAALLAGAGAAAYAVRRRGAVL